MGQGAIEAFHLVVCAWRCVVQVNKNSKGVDGEVWSVWRTRRASNALPRKNYIRDAFSITMVNVEDNIHDAVVEKSQ